MPQKTPTSGRNADAPLELVCFDVGGTLLEERVPRWNIYAEVGARNGIDSAPGRMRDLMRLAHRSLPREIDGAFRYSDPWFRAFIERIFGDELSGSPRQVAAITEQLFRRFEDPGTFRLFAGALELLDHLRSRGVRLAVVSNWSARLPRVLEVMHLAPLFDAVFCSALERAEKPEPALFAKALRACLTRPSAACHVGDQPRYDVDGPRTLGIEPIWIDHTRDARLAGYDDVARVESFQELGQHLLPRLP